jgi:hypothetical protein
MLRWPTCVRCLVRLMAVNVKHVVATEDFPHRRILDPKIFAIGRRLRENGTVTVQPSDCGRP